MNVQYPINTNDQWLKKRRQKAIYNWKLGFGISLPRTECFSIQGARHEVEFGIYW